MESQPKHLSANANRASRRRAKDGDANALMPNPTVSRRTFLSATAVVGALSFLGSLVSPKGTVVNAYADEAGNTHFSVYVLGKDEVPVMAMRQTATGNVAVGGVKVTVTSLYNQKQVVVTTGDDGFVPVHIRDLSFQCEMDDATSYALFADVAASADGYRDVHFTKEYLESAVPAADDGSRPNVLEIPMETDDGSSYLLSASMDDADILHSPVPALVGDYSDIEHTVAVEVMCAPGSSSSAAAVSLIVDDAEWACATTVQDPDKPNLSKASFTDYYLSKIQPGQKLKLRFQVPGEKARTVTFPIEFEPALSTGIGTQKQQVSPGTTLTEMRDDFWMTWFFGESDNLSLCFPFIPVDVFGDAGGNHGLSFTVLTFQPYKEVNGWQTKPDGVKMFGGRVFSSGWNSWRQNIAKSQMAYKEANTMPDGDEKFFGASKFSRQLAVNADVSIMGYAKSEWVDKVAKSGDTTGSGFVGLNGRLGIDASFGQQYCLAMIPCYLNIDISLGVQARFGLMIKFKNYLENVEWVSNALFFPPVIVILSAQAALSLGLGVRGIMGAGVRGYASGGVSLTIGSTPSAESPVSFSANAQAGLQIFVQILFFYKSFLLCHPIEAKYPDDKLAAFNSKALTDIDLSDARAVSQDALMATAEFKSTVSEKAVATFSVEQDGVETTGLSNEMPETYEPIRDHILVDRAPLVTPGPAGASGFASPYGALDANGEVLLGASSSFTSDLAAKDHQAAFRSVGTYNPRLGLIPVEQELIYDQVFSNSHVRAFVGSSAYTNNPEKNTVMARLVTVKVPDNGGRFWTRTRVYVCPWDAERREFGAEQVVNFRVEGLKLEERYDVDYDLDVVEKDGKVLLAMAITSVRVSGDEPVVCDVAMDRQFLTFLVWNVTDKCLVWSKSLYDALVEQGRSTYHPRAVIEGDPKAPFTFLRRIACFYYFRKDVAADQNEGIYVSAYRMDDAVKYTYGDYCDSFAVGGADNDRFLGNGTFDVLCPDHKDVNNAHIPHPFSALAFQDDKGGVSVCGVRLSSQAAKIETVLDLTNVTSISPRGNQESDTLFTYTLDSNSPEEKLNHVIKYDKTASKFIAVETSGYTSDSNIFASADGKRLYTVRLDEGRDNRLSDEAQALLDAGAELQSSAHYCPATGANFGGASTTSDQREPVYQLLESRWIESLGAFHKFYPIARLSFAPDNTAILSCANGHRDFVMANLTGLPSMEEAGDNPEVDVKSDIYHVSVPDVVAIQCESVTVGSPFAAAGDTVTYDVEVSNIGNCLVNGFTVTLRDGDGRVVDEKAYDDLREYLQVSEENYHPVYDEGGEAVVDENGTMVTEFVEDIRDTSGILWPGFLRKYRFSFTMPEGYEGQAEFSVQVSEPRSNPFGSSLSGGEVLLAAGKLSMPNHLSWLEADDFAETLFGAELQSICDPRRMPFSLEQKAVSEAVASSFSAVPAVYQTDDDIDGGGYDTEPKDGTDGDSGKKPARVKVPQTGDKLHSAKGVAAAALVTAAAAGVVKHHEAKHEDNVS